MLHRSSARHFSDPNLRSTARQRETWIAAPRLGLILRGSSFECVPALVAPDSRLQPCRSYWMKQRGSAGQQSSTWMPSRLKQLYAPTDAALKIACQQCSSSVFPLSYPFDTAQPRKMQVLLGGCLPVQETFWIACHCKDCSKHVSEPLACVQGLENEYDRLLAQLHPQDKSRRLAIGTGEKKDS